MICLNSLLILEATCILYQDCLATIPLFFEGDITNRAA